VSKCETSVCRLCRRENLKLFLKGERCFTDKCAFERRPYPPGQHGQSRLKFSEFALQLREKQKTKRYYGVFEKQFRKLFAEAERKKGQTGGNLLGLLEMRFDNVVASMGFAASRREAKQLIRHNHFLINGKRVNIPSVVLKLGDKVEIKEASRNSVKLLGNLESAKRREIPTWVEVVHDQFSGKVKEAPGREQVGVAVEENMIVEYYSR
jgi:small subunit ribosomal protein S4